MSLITNKQQDLIDQSISSYIKFYDKFSSQYLNLRNEIYELSTQALLEIQNASKLSEETIIKAKKLDYEIDVISNTYSIYLKNVTNILEAKKYKSTLHLDKLNIEYDHFANKKEFLIKEINNLKNVQKPLLDDMKSIIKSFDINLNPRSAKRINKSLIEGFLKNEGKETPKQINFSNLVFSKEELKGLFSNINLSPSTVTDDTSETIKQHVNIIRSLEDQLDNSRTFQTIDSSKYVYDISKSSIHGAGASTTIQEYDNMIDGLLTNIRDLLSNGAEAKERWSINAKKLQIIKETLKSIDEATANISDEEMKE